jgi:superfamily II DNA helicase RecQ
MKNIADSPHTVWKSVLGNIAIFIHVMGVDISDIRVVVNYLISETVEQYYQEVGRGGRDGQPAYGYLLYTNQSKRGRMMLLNNSQ